MKYLRSISSYGQPVTKTSAGGVLNSLNHASLVLIIPRHNKTSSLVIFTIILMNLSNMQIIKTSIADAEHYKTYHDNFLFTHLTVIVTPQIEQGRCGGVGGEGEGGDGGGGGGGQKSVGDADMIGTDR